MAENKGTLTDFALLALTTVIATPLLLSVLLVFLIIIGSAWFRFLRLENTGVQTEAEVIQIHQNFTSFGQIITNINYRISPFENPSHTYTGHSAANSELPTVGSTVTIRYLHDDPTISQIGGSPSLNPLLVETLFAGILAMLGFILTTLLALRITTKIARL